MAHIVHLHLRRRLKSALLVCGFALFVVMAALAAHQASNPKLSHGRHAVPAPNVSKGVPVTTADNGPVAHSLPSAAVGTTPAPATPTLPLTNTPASPAQTVSDGSQSAELTQALDLSASLRAVMNRPPAAGQGQQ